MKILDKLYKKVVAYLANMCYPIIRIVGLVEVKDMRCKGTGCATIFDVANFFLKIVDRDSGSTITPLKLQKILYYAQGYYLAKYNKPLFDEDFQAWAHGPANPDIYDKYREYGYNAIDEPTDDLYDFDEETTSFLANIWETFGIYDGKYLEELTHGEEPWINARKGYEPGERCDNVITKDSMKSFFQTEPYNV